VSHIEIFITDRRTVPRVRPESPVLAPAHRAVSTMRQ